ncbi:MAG: DUF3108 domain-containing protein [Flavobacterium sp.]|nr:DUF3108 domain-containing protein [Candidatus Neoflavobacterium equi]
MFSQSAYSEGEFFKFRIHYGVVNAGYATLELKTATRNGKRVFHAVGDGYTVGVTKVLFSVKDDYQSYFDKESNKPYEYIRKIDEGGYTKNQVGYFNQAKNTVQVKDLKGNTDKTSHVPENVQDIVSSFYYLRNHPDVDRLKVGESIVIDMFFDNEIFKFKLKYLGKEDINTKFGKVSSLVFRPYVQSGRVFKEKESLTVWVSDDVNKVPLLIKASLAVGSLKASITEVRGLQKPLTIKK